jgi:hypothetical protein
VATHAEAGVVQQPRRIKEKGKKTSEPRGTSPIALFERIARLTPKKITDEVV